MTDAIDYYFTAISPWVYLGHRSLMAMAGKHSVPVNFRPVILGNLWEHSGSVPLGQRSEMRQRYRFVELQRYGEFRGERVNLKPAFFPTDPGLADRCAAAIVIEGGDPSGFVYAACRAVWAMEENIAEEETIMQLLAAEGHDAGAVLEASARPDVAAMLEANSKAANAADAIGVPAYVYKGETFWGQDRLDVLEAMIVSGRPAYHTV